MGVRKQKQSQCFQLQCGERRALEETRTEWVGLWSEVELEWVGLWVGPRPLESVCSHAPPPPPHTEAREVCFVPSFIALHLGFEPESPTEAETSHFG